ncbi:cell wall metabolism sensor histidine kinase WalK [Selenomonas sp. AE3005]|uniref:sensor histidine kinase n=1 Tax=Selenomonas sp. AE3005 TaxID=1485543 RepID=UPI0009DE5C27|nr:HAMP domain-containing sensor histidine kinase [Selenomonas sp. AE3005]
MQIRRRLFLSNFMMFALPFVIILLMAGALYLSYQEAKLGALGNLAHDKQVVHQVQADIRQTVEQLPVGDSAAWYQNFAELAGRMARDNYHLAVVEGKGVTIYNNLTELEEMQIAEELRPAAFVDDSAVFIFRDSNIVKYMFQREGREYHVVGILSFDIQTGRGLLGGLYRSYLGGLLLAGLVVFLLINMWLAHRLSQTILQPIAALQKAARAVEQRNYDYRIKPVGDEEFASLCQNINDMTAKLGKLEQARQESEQERRTLIAGLSHDIRTPLTVIRGYVEGLQDGVAKDQAMAARYLGKIAEGTAQISRLLERLFLYSKLNMEAYPFNFRQVEFGGWLRQKEGELRQLLPAGELVLALQSELRENGGVWVQIDSTEIQRVLTNLIENAVKYHPEPAQLKIRIEAECQQGELHLRLADNGPGVQAENLPRLFQEFYRTDMARSETKQGSGLGLAICKRIIEAHGGRIWAEDGRSAGSTGLVVCIVLPVVNKTGD